MDCFAIFFGESMIRKNLTPATSGNNRDRFPEQREGAAARKTKAAKILIRELTPRTGFQYSSLFKDYP